MNFFVVNLKTAAKIGKIIFEGRNACYFVDCNTFMKRIAFVLSVFFTLNLFSQENNIQMIAHDFGIRIPNCSIVIDQFYEANEMELVFEFETTCFDLLVEELKKANEHLIVLSIDSMLFENNSLDGLLAILDVDKVKKQLKYRRYF